MTADAGSFHMSESNFNRAMKVLFPTGEEFQAQQVKLLMTHFHASHRDALKLFRLGARMIIVGHDERLELV